MIKAIINDFAENTYIINEKAEAYIIDPGTNYEKIKEINPEKQKDGSQKQMRDVWSLPLVQGKERLRGKDGRALHPTQKPEEMLKRIIIASSNKGDLVLDPFLGSGTTVVVAEQLKRNWIGIEINKKYVEFAKKRIKDYKNK